MKGHPSADSAAFWTRRDTLAFLLPCLGALSVYLFSLPPSVTLEDAGELIVAADHLGVPHPPGYPLWTLLAWLFQWILSGVTYRGYPNPAWPVALMSAVFGSLTCGLVSVCTAKLIRSLSRPSPPHRNRDRTRNRHHLTQTLRVLLLLTLSTFTVWSTAPSPSLWIVLPLSLAATLILLLLSMLLRCRLTRILNTNALDSDIHRSGLDVLLGIASGLLLAFTPLMYSQAVIAEVYTLNAFFVALLLFLVLAYLQHPTPRLLLLLGFSFSLGLTNHHGLLFLAPFLVAGVFAAHHGAPFSAIGWRSLLQLVLVCLLGLSLYAYMPIASSQNPPMNWGNTQTWEGFRHSLTRGQYAGFEVKENLHTFKERGTFFQVLGTILHDPDWSTSIASQFSLQLPLEDPDPGGNRPPPPQRTIPFALWGLLPLLAFTAFPAKLRAWFISSMVAMFFLTVVFMVIQAPEPALHDLWVKRVQYLPAHVLFAIWMGLGAALTTLLLYVLAPKRITLLLSGLSLCTLFTVFPLWKEANDPRLQEHLGSSSQRGQDFGWRFGFFQLRGANGILLEELAHHDDPPARLTEWSAAYLKQHGIWSPGVGILFNKMGDAPLPLSEFRKAAFSLFRGSEAEQKWIEEAALLGAFRALSPDEQQAAMRHFSRPLPDWDYPEEMDPNAILFGGTDPGRFVPTYMVFSARVRPDVYVLTQTALADSTYLTTLRDFHGDEITLPDFLDANRAFLDYADELRLFAPAQYAAVMGTGDSMAVSGTEEVNRINARLTRQIVERNAHAHSFYFEQAIHMPWTTTHLRPHGLIFKLEPEPVDLSPSEIRKSREFWDWMEEQLLRPEPGGGRNRFQRDLAARKTVSKLRMSQAMNLHERGLRHQSEQAMHQAMRFYPANPEASLLASDFYVQRGDFAAARQMLSDLARHDPANRQLQRYTRSLAVLEELDRERVQLEKDLLLKPSGNTALKLLQIYSSLKQPERVQEMADMILRLPRLHPDFYPNLATLMQQEENLETYRKALQTWAEKDKNNYLPLIDLAVIELVDNEYTKMVEYLVRAVQLDPVNARRQIAEDPRFLDIRHWTQFQRLVQQP